MRIGLFGGTFNPVHFGHLRTILEVKEDFSLDNIIFIPSAIPPHKAPKGIADAKDRVEMIRMAIGDQQGFTVSDVELDRPGPSYSIDTVCHFRTTLPPETRLYLILGMDAFLEIDTWKSYRDFFDRVPFIVMYRRLKGKPERGEHEKKIGQFLRSKISEGYRFSASRKCHVHETKQPVWGAPVTLLDISSTKIRNLIRAGKSIRFLLPVSVADYIQTKGFYR